MYRERHVGVFPAPPFATPERKRTIEHAVCTLYCLLTPRTRAPARADVMRDGYVRDCAVLSARASPGIRSKCVGALLFHLRANTPAAVVHRNSDRTSDYSTHRQHTHTQNTHTRAKRRDVIENPYTLLKYCGLFGVCFCLCSCSYAPSNWNQ